MAWFQSPVKLFSLSALLLLVARLAFQPVGNGAQLHSFVYFYDFRLDATGYGVYEVVAVIFLRSALTYYLIPRVLKHPLNDMVGQLHFWPSFFFGAFSVYMTHRVSTIPRSDVSHGIQASLTRWLTVFTWAYVAFLIIQLLFVFTVVAAQIDGTWFRRTFRWLRGEN